MAIMKSDRRHCGRNKLFNIHSMSIGFMLIVLTMVCEINGAAVIKRNASPDFNLESAENSADKLNVNYDEYPVRNFFINFLRLFFLTINQCFIHEL